MTTGYPDYEGNKSGVYLVQQWAVIKSTDKTFQGVAVATKAFGAGHTVNYTVTAGKTLYITEFYISNYAVAAADADNNQICRGILSVGGTAKIAIGGNGGALTSLQEALPAGSLVAVSAQCTNWSNHNTYPGVGFRGYEE